MSHICGLIQRNNTIANKQDVAFHGSPEMQMPSATSSKGSLLSRISRFRSPFFRRKPAQNISSETEPSGEDSRLSMRRQSYYSFWNKGRGKGRKKLADYKSRGEQEPQAFPTNNFPQLFQPQFQKTFTPQQISPSVFNQLRNFPSQPTQQIPQYFISAPVFEPANQATISPPVNFMTSLQSPIAPPETG